MPLTILRRVYRRRTQDHAEIHRTLVAYQAIPCFPLRCSLDGTTSPRCADTPKPFGGSRLSVLAQYIFTHRFQDVPLTPEHLRVWEGDLQRARLAL